MTHRTGTATTQRIRLIEGATELPADGRSSTRLCFAVPDGLETVSLRLSGRASFERETRVSRIELQVTDGTARVIVYAPRRPGSAVLHVGEQRIRLRFNPVSTMQLVLYDWAPTVVLALFMALVLRGYAFASFFIPSPSMERTLMIGDRLIAEKFSYTVLKTPAQRGDIVLFHPPHEPREVWIKRCVGLPGDVVKARDGVVYVNGAPLEEDEYIAEPPDEDFGPVEVPEGSYFVMGDNRNNSTDSRVWGPLPAQNLIGRAVLVVWPPSHAQLLRNPLEEGARKALLHHNSR